MRVDKYFITINCYNTIQLINKLKPTIATTNMLFFYKVKPLSSYITQYTRRCTVTVKI